MAISKAEQWWNEENQAVVNIQEKETPRKSYEERLVAWIDILGMRNKIKDYKNNDAESIFTVMEQLRHFVEVPCAKLAKLDRLHYIQVADGFMIVADTEYATEFCEILSDVQWRVFVECQMLLRGAATVGKVSVSEDPQIIIGPAYIEAYMLESESAIYPRIILTDSFLQATKDCLSFKYISTDTDKEKYLDFLSYAINKNALDKKRVEHILETQGVFKVIRENLKPIKSEEKTSRSVLQKYGWILSKLEQNNLKVY